ncbi:phage tail tube protein|uniref:Phage tail tube protein n=1 Tax=Dendrosporobacter quercicolus TaxID=146817 RepID=A0A1G9YTB8_9FIRM|nr:phage tail tube protein [Dendrosporobacter quercicolus]NSL49879.1 phage tail tube protein [Dendrosporobacter quercicolus DSM 1736]SDN12354.1 Phage tail tube protein [Dendrosporobacter quercicolus]
MRTTMHAKDVLLAKLASCYITVNGERHLALQAKDLTATVEKEKVEVPILGRMMKGHKTVSMTGTGSLTVYQNTALFTNMVKKAKDSGLDIYFDMMVVNEDPASDAGSRIVTLKDCNIDGCDIAAFDADGELLEQSIDFTFEDFEIVKNFKELEGVTQ